MNTKNAYLFLNGNLSEIDRDTFQIIEFEKRRQERKIILIASESICPRPVLEAEASVFSNIYAEGYPALKMSRTEREDILDFGKCLPLHRRLGDRRHYQGCDYTNFIEALAQWRAAQLYAHSDGNITVKPEDIFVNVQPLSGAAANNAVYFALVPPGEPILGLALPHGGHLTHGSKFNRSGKVYQAFSYEVDENTGHINYDQVRRLAQQHHPKMIIAGASAHPWKIDWRRLREIADEVGAFLMADIAHPSGLVAVGLFPNPVGYAHVTTTTTHKTLCGPRGAIIMTTDAKLAQRIDSAVFPGEQGGPHINTIAALAVTFKLAASEEYRNLMRSVLQNAVSLADSLKKRGCKIAYGGTETHLCLVDLNPMKSLSGNPIKGDTAALLLDLCGITCNKNTIPGDITAGDSSAIRLGTTWVSQLGMDTADMDKIAGLIHRVLTNIYTYPFSTGKTSRYRGKISHELILDIRQEVANLLRRDEHPDYPQFPHYHRPFSAAIRENIEQNQHTTCDIGVVKDADREWDCAQKHAVMIHRPEAGILEISGEKAEIFLADATPANIYAIENGHGIRTILLDRRGEWIDDIHLFRIADKNNAPCFWMITNSHAREYVKEWLSDLSDGHVLLDEDCPCNRLAGPIRCRDLAEEDVPLTTLILAGPKTSEILCAMDTSLANLEPFCIRPVIWEQIPMMIARTGYEQNQILYELYVPTQQLPSLVCKLEKGDLQRAGEGILDNLRKQAGLPVEKVLLPHFVREKGKNLSEACCTEAIVAKFPLYFYSNKPYFVGASAVLKQSNPNVNIAKVNHTHAPYRGEPRFTQIAEDHKKLTSRALSPFAGWWMPILYTSILEEHKAVRERAGLFDVSHMGVLEVEGKGADRFLDLVSTNEVSKIEIGQSQYGYLITPQGNVLDDIMVYRRGIQRFMVVVNAVNAEMDLEWLQKVVRREVIIDTDFPNREVDATPNILDLKHESSGKYRKVDIALQGPNSLEILQSLAGDDKMLKESLKSIGKACFIEAEIMGMPLIISHSGYTGEPWGFELYVHPDEASKLWNLLLEKGKSHGIQPTGLGSRDSTRTEAGFPLHGHELAGTHDITPLEAGYGGFVKYYKPFFIGKRPLMQRDARSRYRVVRFEMEETGIRAVRSGATVLNQRGQVIGVVTSCTFIGDRQIGMAYVDNRYDKEDTHLGILNIPQGKQPPLRDIAELKPGDTFPVSSSARIISRFMRKESQ